MTTGATDRLSTSANDIEVRTPFVTAEIRRQPDAWRAAARLLPDLAAILPAPGARVAVLGCGTSWFVAQAYAALRQQRGIGRTDAFAASEFLAGSDYDDYDTVVVISRSGTTTEVLSAVRATRSRVVGITAVADSPVAQAVDEPVVLAFADEQSVVQTLFATTALALLRASLGTDVDGLATAAENVLAGAAPLPAEVGAVEQVTFLGQGWAYGIAQEAALKMREAAQLWTEAYLQMEYRHGPIAIAQPGRAVWVFGTPVGGIRADIATTGATLVDDDLDPMVDLVRAQQLAVAQAESRGLDPDRPRSLTRSVVLAPGA